MSIKQVELRNGEELKVVVVEPPVPGAVVSSYEEFDATFNEVPVHFGWKDVGPQVLAGWYAHSARDRFFVGRIDDEVVGSVLLHTPARNGEVGLTLHVLTKTRHRGKGVQTHLYEALTETFRREGGRMLYLPTSNPVASQLYMGAGFLHHVGDGMRYLTPGNEDFDDTYLGHEGEATVRPATWGDLSWFALLHNNTRLDWVVRYYLPFSDWKVFNGVRFLGHFRRLLMDAESGRGHLAVMEDVRNRVVAVASLAEVPSYHEQHIKVLNFIAAPAYFDQSVDIVETIVADSISTGTEVVHTYLAESDQAKGDVLDRAGFREEGRLVAGLALDDERRIDLLIYARHLSGPVRLRRRSSEYYGGRPAYLNC